MPCTRNSRDWVPGGRIPARLYNTNYIDGTFTKTESVKSWRQIGLTFKAAHIEAAIDDKNVAEVDDRTHRAGLTGIGSRWNLAEFNDFAVR